MRLAAALRGDLEKYLKAELVSAEDAMMRGMKSATEGLKNEMRAQTNSAGLGRGLAYSWRGNTYPKTQKSLNPTGFIYTRAEKILSGYEQGAVITAKKSKYIAIPTSNIPKRIKRRKTTPKLYEQSRNTKLSPVIRGGKGFLVDHQAVASYNRRTGMLRGYRKASSRALKTGKGLTSIIAFWLVPSVRMKKKIDFDKASQKWQALVPSLIVQNWREVH